MKPIVPAILLIDDDLDFCHNMSDILNDRGYRVDTAHEGRTALRLLERQTYDMALLDWKMPGMDGLTLCRELTRQHPATVAVMITGYPEDVVPAEARAVGVRRIFPKPVDVRQLLVGIEEALAGSPRPRRIPNDCWPRNPYGDSVISEASP
jgi:DNA-binding response OmpR family regulator